jgi:hypothetical protein
VPPSLPTLPTPLTSLPSSNTPLFPLPSALCHFYPSVAECMVLKLKGHNFDFQLSVNCAERENVDMKFNTGRSSGKEEEEEGYDDEL